jgi:hypothetical protein
MQFMRIDHNFLDPHLLEIELEKLRSFIPAERTSFRMIVGAVRHLVMLLF